jgi:hypothetical protein
MGFVKGILPVLYCLAVFMAGVYLVKYIADRWNGL